MSTVNTAERIDTLDAIRGVAVLGILLMNIVDIAMPGWAYYDPYYYGGSEGVNFATWAINYALFDGKMRGLFTMMFGASTVLIAERALKSGESPARVHYARMFWLLVFGMIHVWFIWYGDILVLYAVAGMIAFVAWRWSVRTLIITGIALLVLKLLLATWTYTSLRGLETAANAPNAPASVQQEWRATQEEMTFPPPQTQLDGYLGSYMDAFKVRAPVSMYILTEAHPLAMTDTLALIAFGMALFRLGFFSGAWSKTTYRRIALWGFAICVPLHIPLILWNDADRFSPITLHITEALHLTLLRPWLVLAHASVVILFMQSGAASWLAERLIAVGRMAFSNYIASSIICVLIFHGYGLGLYGQLERWQCYPVVLLIWVVLLGWSKPWLERYAYGPLEWLWRSLVRGRRQPLSRPADRPA
ncbi:DUF418 domain-containing protein [Steroidobacter sp.]|uniref:DUF418 domain-containing protein n=1 Tax=Steroidobacter sp. TaxID=1978227 RepID=UPI001A4C5312|nr:DUF418 domain-containing protein [Steroidobacter sp.]MBL8265025.1 DUF418 domain-containing protein [Steroidobacter sp.]